MIQRVSSAAAGAAAFDAAAAAAGSGLFQVPQEQVGRGLHCPILKMKMTRGHDETHPQDGLPGGECSGSHGPAVSNAAASVFGYCCLLPHSSMGQELPLFLPWFPP